MEDAIPYSGDNAELKGAAVPSIGLGTTPQRGPLSALACMPAPICSYNVHAATTAEKVRAAAIAAERRRRILGLDKRGSRVTQPYRTRALNGVA